MNLVLHNINILVAIDDEVFVFYFVSIKTRSGQWIFDDKVYNDFENFRYPEIPAGLGEYTCPIVIDKLSVWFNFALFFFC